LDAVLVGEENVLVPALGKPLVLLVGLECKVRTGAHLAAFPDDACHFVDSSCAKVVLVHPFAHCGRQLEWICLLWLVQRAFVHLDG